MGCQAGVQAGHVAGRVAAAGGRRRRRHRQPALAGGLRALGQGGGRAQRSPPRQDPAPARRRAPARPARPPRAALHPHRAAPLTAGNMAFWGSALPSKHNTTTHIASVHHLREITVAILYLNVFEHIL